MTPRVAVEERTRGQKEMKEMAEEEVVVVEEVEGKCEVVENVIRKAEEENEEEEGLDWEKEVERGDVGVLSVVEVEVQVHLEDLE